MAETNVLDQRIAEINAAKEITIAIIEKAAVTPLLGNEPNKEAGRSAGFGSQVFKTVWKAVSNLSK